MEKPRMRLKRSSDCVRNVEILKSESNVLLDWRNKLTADVGPILAQRLREASLPYYELHYTS